MPVSLDEIVALNDEIAALVRAGVPLDKGLMQLGADLPGRLGELAATIGRRLESGESLQQIVSGDQETFPPVYAAVVQAGIRSGRLAVALEGLSDTVRRVSETRRQVSIALIYPLAVILTAYGVALYCSIRLLPSLHDDYVEFYGTESSWLQWQSWIAVQFATWWYLPPVIGVATGIVWYWHARRSLRDGRGWFSMSGRPIFTGRLAVFTEVLSLLVEQQVSLDEALVLAADASGNRQLRQSSRYLAGQIRSGSNGQTEQDRLLGFPPMLRWLITSQAGHAQLCSGLRRLAESYRDRARRLNEWTTIYLPIILTVGVGGGTVALLSFAVLGPWFDLLFRLGQPGGG